MHGWSICFLGVGNVIRWIRLAQFWKFMLSMALITFVCFVCVLCFIVCHSVAWVVVMLYESPGGNQVDG